MNRNRNNPLRPRIGLALGGGGAKGLAHIGVLKALDESQIPIDFIAGTSVGALIGGAYASGVTVDQMIRLALRTRWRDLGRLTLSKLGFRDSATIEEFVRQYFPVSTFEEAKLPFAAVAADICTGEPEIIQKGDLARAIRASCAVPGYFTPMVSDRGRMLVDGGIVLNLPTSVVRRMGADRVIGVDVYPSAARDKAPTNAYQIYVQSIAIVASRSGRSARADADLLVIPQVAGVAWDEIERAPELIGAGEEAMLRSLDTCRKWLAERDRPKGLFKRLFSWRSVLK